MNNPPWHPQQPSYPSSPRPPDQPPQSARPAQPYPTNQPGARVPYEQPHPQWSWGPADSQSSRMNQQADPPPNRRPGSPWLRLALAFVGGIVLGVLLLGGGIKTGIIPVHSSAAKQSAAPPVPASAIVYVVTGVSANSLATVAPNSHPVFVHISSSTTYQRDGLTAALKDIVVGTRVNIRGKFTADGSITAERIAILDPGISGQIKAILASSLSLAVKSQTVVVVLDADTRVVNAKSHQPVSLSTLHTGQTIQVYGAYNNDGHIVAVVIAV